MSTYFVLTIISHECFREFFAHSSLAMAYKALLLAFLGSNQVGIRACVFMGHLLFVLFDFDNE